MTNFERIAKELIGMKEDLRKEEVLGRKFTKFERKFDKLLEIVNFQLLNDSNDKFYGTWLSNANRVKCYGINTAVSHQVTNTRINLLVNPLIYCEKDIEEAKLLLKHEVVHLISEHYKRVNELKEVYPRILPLLASDLVANYSLSKDGTTLPKSFWTAETMKDLFEVDMIIDDSSTVEGVTKELNELRNTNEKFDSFVSNASGGKMEEMLKMISSSLANGSSNGDDGEAEFDEDMAKGLLQSIMQSTDSDDLLISDMIKHVTIESASQSRGKFPSGLAGIIKKMMEPPVITWEEQLRRFISSVAAGKKPTIFRRNRRQPTRLDLKGELRDMELDLVIAIDTSGSMSDDLVAKCMTEIFDIVKLMKAEITIIECDSRIQKVYKVNTANDVQPEIYGRGGTSFSPVFEWMKENKNSDSVLVYMSDGYGESRLTCKSNHQGTLWVMTDRKDCLSLQGPNLPPRSKVVSLTNK